MFDGKLRVEKVEMVKRVIRQNNYHQYEKTHQQCIELGLNVNRPALDRFANKLELIDKAQLSKRQNQLQQLDYAKQQAALEKSQIESNTQYDDMQLSEGATSASHQTKISRTQPTAVQMRHQATSSSSAKQTLDRKQMTYEQVKQRETEITFALGELKIRENELLQELISLSEMLENRQIN